MEVPDYAAILVTGDLVQDDPSGYLRFRSIFGNCPKPVLCIPGNHDEPEAMRAHSPARAVPDTAAPIARAGWQFVMLDSYDAGTRGGRLTRTSSSAWTARWRLARARDGLSASPSRSRWAAAGSTASASPMPTISGALSMRTLTCGPSPGATCTRSYDGERGNVRLFATPSTGAQFLPKSDRYAVDSRPPAYRPFALHSDGASRPRCAG